MSLTLRLHPNPMILVPLLPYKTQETQERGGILSYYSYSYSYSYSHRVNPPNTFLSPLSLQNTFSLYIKDLQKPQGASRSLKDFIPLVYQGLTKSLESSLSPQINVARSLTALRAPDTFTFHYTTEHHDNDEF